MLLTPWSLLGGQRTTVILFPTIFPSYEVFALLHPRIYSLNLELITDPLNNVMNRSKHVNLLASEFFSYLSRAMAGFLSGKRPGRKIQFRRSLQQTDLGRTYDAYVLANQSLCVVKRIGVWCLHQVFEPQGS